MVSQIDYLSAAKPSTSRNSSAPANSPRQRRPSVPPVQRTNHIVHCCRAGLNVTSCRRRPSARCPFQTVRWWRGPTLARGCRACSSCRRRSQLGDALPPSTCCPRRGRGRPPASSSRQWRRSQSAAAALEGVRGARPDQNRKTSISRCSFTRDLTEIAQGQARSRHGRDGRRVMQVLSRRKEQPRADRRAGRQERRSSKGWPAHHQR